MRTRPLVLALAMAVSTVLAGCGNGGDAHTSDTLAPRLTTAKKTLDTAETITLDLSTKSLPSGVTGLLSAAGTGNHSPAFTGKVKVKTGGASLSAKVVAVGGKVYAKTGFAPTYLTIDPASLKAPDPAALLATSGGISDLMIKTTNLKAGGKTRDGSAVLSSITGTLSGDTVRSLVPSAKATKPFHVTYHLTSKDELHDAVIKGPFYPGSGAITYTVDVSTSQTPVTITKP